MVTVNMADFKLSASLVGHDDDVSEHSRLSTAHPAHYYARYLLPVHI